MSQNVTLFQIFCTKLRLPFMFGFGSERLSQSRSEPDSKTENRNRAHFLSCFSLCRSFWTISIETETETGLYQSQSKVWPFVTFVTKIWQISFAKKTEKNQRNKFGHKFKFATVCDRRKCHKLVTRSAWLMQPVLLKMKLEMVIGMQIEILNGIKKLPFDGSFQNFTWKKT